MTQTEHPSAGDRPYDTAFCVRCRRTMDRATMTQDSLGHRRCAGKATIACDRTVRERGAAPAKAHVEP